MTPTDHQPCKGRPLPIAKLPGPIRHQLQISSGIIQMLSGAEDILKNSKSKRHSIYRCDGSVEQVPSMEHSKANGG